MQKTAQKICQFKQRNNAHFISTTGNVLSHPGLANLWQPDTHLLNAKSIAKPETITHISMMGKVILYGYNSLKNSITLR